MDGVDEEQRRRGRKASLKIKLNFLRRMKQEELADCLQSSKRILTGTAATLCNQQYWIPCRQTYFMFTVHVFLKT